MSASDFRWPAGNWIDDGGEAAERDEVVHNLLPHVVSRVDRIDAPLFNSSKPNRVSMIVVAERLSIGLALARRSPAKGGAN